MGKDPRKKESAGCPVGRFCMDIERLFGAESEIGGHLHRSQLELLKAVRAWVDERLERLERGQEPRRKKKVTKIRVE
jgi:hypothetical protein